MRPVVDLFAGPGGWDVAARALGLDPLGVEFDDAACATRAAAGLRTVQTDVSQLDPREFMREQFSTAGGRPRGDGHHPLWGLIASPPCQAFSMAGKGAGRKALDAYLRQIADMAAGLPMEREWLDEACADDRAHLVLEPLRWALTLTPEWIALEQVEPVLPLWEATAAGLRAHGYRAWTGMLSAEQYGVAQTRRRAILLASRVRVVGRPAPSHQRYVPPRKVEEATLGLFDAPEPERIVVGEDRELEPWVSMAQALGWDRRDVAGFPRRADGLRSIELAGVEYRERDLRQASQPAFALTEKSRSWLRFRAMDEPAPTLRFGARLNTVAWVDERPATTVAGDPRVFPPGHKLNADDERAGRGAQRRSGAGPVDGEGSAVEGSAAVRVSLAQALVLQSFPPDYPVQGSNTKRFEQVGNAIPPLLALAALREVMAAD